MEAHEETAIFSYLDLIDFQRCFAPAELTAAGQTKN
jgi:hypothetical protein